MARLARSDAGPRRHQQRDRIDHCQQAAKPPRRVAADRAHALLTLFDGANSVAQRWSKLCGVELIAVHGIDNM